MVPGERVKVINEGQEHTGVIEKTYNGYSCVVHWKQRDKKTKMLFNIHRLFSKEELEGRKR